MTGNGNPRKIQSRSLLKTIWDKSYVRPIVYLAAIYALWQLLYASGRFPELLFPSLNDVLATLWKELLDGSLLSAVGYSLRLILIGMAVAVAIAMIVSVLAMFFEGVKELVESMISVFDPLPGIAILPIAILWFGIGPDAIIFIMVYSIIWPFLLNVIGGFSSIPVIYKEVGRSVGLKGIRMVTGVYFPATVPSILTGFKTGWSRAWRALISAEMIFGASGSSGGLGWDIYKKKAYLNMAGMFATLIVIMAIGIIIEKVVFKNVEKVTVRKWGMMS